MSMLIAVWTVVLIVVAVCLFLMRRIMIDMRSGNIRFIQEKNSRNRLFILFRFFQEFPLTKREFRRIRNRVRVLYPSDEISVNQESTKIMGTASLAFLIVITLAVLLSGGDLFYILFGLFTASVLFKNISTRKLDRADEQILVEFSEFVSGLISSYREHNGHLDDAIYSMIDDLPKVIALHMSGIYDILSCAAPEREAERYTDYAPNRFLLSFVSLAVPTKIYGDKTLEDGNTAFIKGLMNLKKEMNAELIKREKISNAFSSLTIISIVPVFLIKPIQIATTKVVPQLESFFSGPGGMAVLAVIFLTTYICYTMINSLKTVTQEVIRDSTIWSRIAAIPAVNAFLNIQINRHYTALSRKEKDLRSSGDRTGIKAFLVESAAFAAAIFLLLNMMFIWADHRAKHYTINDFSTEYSTAIVPNETYVNEMKSVSALLMRSYQKNGFPSGDEKSVRAKIAQDVRSHSEILKADNYVDPVIDTVITRFILYRAIYFKWYYELIAIIAAVVAFMIPSFFLWFKSAQVQMAKEDEVNSFNLLALIFMDLEGTQVSTMLEWMERFSFSYRDAIENCLISLEMGEQKALQKLYEYDTMFEFRKFVRSLMSVDGVGFRKAFQDVEIQKDYYNEKRRVDNEKLITRKSNAAAMVAFIPLYLTIILYLLMPMGILVFNMLTTLASQLGSSGIM